MKILIIKSHPASYGFTHKISGFVKEKLETNGDEVFVMDLYDSEWKQDFLYFEDLGDLNEKEKRKKIQKKIIWADKLIFVYPMWWYSTPAILKNFIDQNFTSNFAYTFKNKKPKGLLKEKTALILTTADTPSFVMFFLSFFIKTPLRLPLSFCGIKVLSINIFSGMIEKKSDKDRLKILNKIKKIVI